MHRKRLLCWKAYLPRSSWPTQPTTPIICARPSLPKARSPSSPTTRHGRSNIRSTSISMPSAISWNAASQNSNNSAASQPASKRQPEITLPSSLSQPSSYGCDKCPHHLVGINVQSDKYTMINSPMIHNDPLYQALLDKGVKTIDAQHVFVAPNNTCPASLTCDVGTLSRSTAIEKLCGVVVQRPSAFVASQRW